MEASLDDSKTDVAYGINDGRMKVSYPLLQCMQGLQEKYTIVSKLHRERFEQVRSKLLLFRIMLKGSFAK